MNSKNRGLTVFISILVGLLFGSIVLLIAGHNPIKVMFNLVYGVVNTPTSISYTLINMAPLLLTGIAAAFAFKTGLFNIGIEGQFLVGSVAAAFAGIYFDLPPVIHPLFCMLCAITAGGLFGAIVGFLKAKFNVNEVISSIMLNWIALYFNNFVLTWNSIRQPNSDFSFNINSNASIRILENWKTSEAGVEFLSKSSFLQNFFKAPVNYGLLIGIIVAILTWFILKKTTLGFELKAVGLNKDAAKFSGISVNTKIMQAMFISGAIGGLAGAIDVLGVTHRIGVLSLQPGVGFDGIAIALIALNNPIAVIPSALFFAALKYGGGKLTLSVGVPGEIVSIVIGFIVFFISIPFIIKSFKRAKNKNSDKENSKWIYKK